MGKICNKRKRIYVDDEKDATQVICLINKIFYRNIILKEYYVIVDKPGEFYLTYCSPEDGKGATIAESLL